ncbi:VWA domain-containing protein [Paracoccus sp. WLY502]|uniref:vWA domain-containing protein n=1 Tax=Paracoccus yibinensis TaxID=3068891 RepID=UPI0027967B13|nr:VWA domain-containing protein [Paracoccus sp. WLY502]MDQ1902375.1 VWA domain-containing protein [Paracoccus sp. WLY502]
MKSTSILTIAISSLAISAQLTFANEHETKRNGETILLFDSSGSMAGRFENNTKFRLAVNALDVISQQLTDVDTLGFIALGNTSRDQCSQETFSGSLSRLTSRELINTARNLRPRGDTPLAIALGRAVSATPRDIPLQIIVITDGQDSCSNDVCIAAKTIAENSKEVRIDVIGFSDPNLISQQAPFCMSTATGGRYIQATNILDIRSLTNGLTSAEALLLCSSTPEYRRSNNCTFRVKQDVNGNVFRIGANGLNDATDIRLLDTEDLSSASFTTEQVDKILQAVSLYSPYTSQILINKALVCSLDESSEPNSAMLSIALIAAKTKVQCSNQQSNTRWLNISRNFIAKLRTDECINIRSEDLNTKEKLIDEALDDYVFSGIKTVLQAELIKELLLFDDWWRACTQPAIHTNSPYLSSRSISELYLSRENLMSLKSTESTATRAEVRDSHAEGTKPISSLSDLYNDNSNGLLRTTNEIKTFCDAYDPQWRRRKPETDSLDLEELNAGCFTYKPLSKEGTIINKSNNIYSGFGTIVFLNSGNYKLDAGNTGSALFANLHQVNDSRTYDIISFPVFFGTSGKEMSSVEEVYSFHFVPRVDVTFAKNLITVPDIPTEVRQALIADGEGIQKELTQLMMPDRSQINIPQIQKNLHLSTSGLLGTPWYHLGSLADVCTTVSKFKENGEIFSLYGWDALLTEEDAADMTNFCGTDSGPQCLARIIDVLRCTDLNSNAQLVGTEQYDMDVVEHIIKRDIRQ